MLPHCDINGNCQPIDLPVDGCNNVVEISKAFLDSFWMSRFYYAFRPFNVSITDETHIEKLGRGRRARQARQNVLISSFDDWESKIKNPLDILKADFLDGGHTIRYFMDRYSSGRHHTLVGNQVERHLHGVVNTITESFNSQELADQIYSATEQVVNAVMQNVFSESALQSK